MGPGESDDDGRPADSEVGGGINVKTFSALAFSPSYLPSAAGVQLFQVVSLRTKDSHLMLHIKIIVSY